MAREAGLDSFAAGPLHIGEQAGGAAGGLKQDVVAVVGAEKVETVGRVFTELAADTEFIIAGDNIFQWRVGEEGVGQAAFEFHIVGVFAGGDGVFDGEIVDIFVATQFDGRGGAVRFPGGCVQIEVFRRLPTQADGGVDPGEAVVAIEFGPLAGKIAQADTGAVGPGGKREREIFA